MHRPAKTPPARAAAVAEGVVAAVAKAAVKAAVKAGVNAAKDAAKAVARVATKPACPHQLVPRTKCSVQTWKVHPSPTSQPVARVPASRNGMRVIPASHVSSANPASRVRQVNAPSAGVAAAGVVGVTVATRWLRRERFPPHQVRRRHHPPWGQWPKRSRSRCKCPCR